MELLLLLYAAVLCVTAGLGLWGGAGAWLGAAGGTTAAEADGVPAAGVAVAEAGVKAGPKGANRLLSVATWVSMVGGPVPTLA